MAYQLYFLKNDLIKYWSFLVSFDGWMYKNMYTHTYIYTQDRIQPLKRRNTAICNDIDSIILSEMSDREIQMPYAYDLIHMWNLEKRGLIDTRRNWWFPEAGLKEVIGGGGKNYKFWVLK